MKKYFEYKGKKYIWTMRLWQFFLMIVVCIIGLYGLIFIFAYFETPQVDAESIQKAASIKQSQSIKEQHKKMTEERKKIKVVSSSSIKRFEPLDTITDTTSSQYKLLHKSYVAHRKDGTIKIKGRYAVALGSKFGKIGSKYDFILKNKSGTHTLKVIKAEEKADYDTIDGWYCPDGHVIEVIIDRNVLSSTFWRLGDLNGMKDFNGTIKNIYKISK